MEHKYRLAEVSVTRLRFDAQNPRLVHRVGEGEVDSVLRYMLEDAALVDLASSIATQGFFPGEPLLCCPDPELEPGTEPPPPSEDDDSPYTVIEGNRRLAAVLLLNNPDARRRFKSWPLRPSLPPRCR
jgi:hypothetical protein